MENIRIRPEHRFTSAYPFVHTSATRRAPGDLILHAMRVPAAGLSLIALLLIAALSPAPAAAVISDARTLEGPSADVLDVGGVAMSQDGSGGVVYRKRVDGRSRIFAAQFADGAWRAPQRVDRGQRFDSSWPAIGAGDGGRLVVTWVQEFGPESDRLFSASLEPGATSFQDAVPVDLNIGEATSTWPSLAMSRSGQAYVLYRTAKDPTTTPGLPPGTVEGEYRLARLNGQLWSPLGFPLNRNAGAPVSAPAASNAPRVAIDAGGGAVVAWQERDDDFIDRIYARRVFGLTLGNPLLVSPQRSGDRPLRAPADRPALDVSGFGQAVVAFRQHPEPGVPAGRERVWSAVLPDSSSAAAATFKPARIADGLGDAGPGGPLGPASVATVPGGLFTTAFAVGAQSLAVSGDDAGVRAPERLDDGRTSEPGDPVVDLAASGAVVSAWKTLVAGRGQVAVAEGRADGVPSARSLSALRGGRVVTLALGGSGLGDALIAWQQGSDRFAQVAVASVDAPPEEFAVQVPIGFTSRRGKLTLRWEAASNAIGGVRYAVTLDDEEVVSDITRRRHDLRLGQLADGVIPVSVIATDSGGQETSSTAATLKLDRRPPSVRIRARGRGRIRVEVRDGARGQVSGADHAATRVRWGDGRSARGRSGSAAVTHTYRGRGRVRVTVSVRDLVGNTRTVRRAVTIR